MSGEVFGGKMYVFEEIREQIEQIIEQVSTKPNLVDILSDDFSYYNYVEDKETFITTCEAALYFLEMGQSITNRINMFLSGDDGEESFQKRLHEDLEKLSLKWSNYTDGMQDENK